MYVHNVCSLTYIMYHQDAVRHLHFYLLLKKATAFPKQPTQYFSQCQLFKYIFLFLTCLATHQTFLGFQYIFYFKVSSIVLTYNRFSGRLSVLLVCHSKILNCMLTRTVRTLQQSQRVPSKYQEWYLLQARVFYLKMQYS